jgi:CheY-like chemotaxis protein
MRAARILVIEDNPLSRRLARDILLHRGHQVFEAADVEEGLALLERFDPDLVVTDLQVPGGGGERVLQTIRADPSLASLPVVVVTASAMRGDRERLLALGFDGYLSKPIDTRAFGSAIEAFLVRKGDGDGA